VIVASLDRLAAGPQLLDDWPRRIAAARELAAQWGAQARRLGWRDVDLFGLQPAQPATRRDGRGLAWCLGDGERVTAITADAATIETGTGARLRFYRERRDTGAVVAWQLAAVTGGNP
jgi:hypothetical protein